MSAQEQSGKGLPGDHVDPLRVYPSSVSTKASDNVAGKYKGMKLGDAAGFVILLRSKQPELTKDQCLAFLQEEINLGYCVRAPNGRLTWN